MCESLSYGNAGFTTGRMPFPYLFPGEVYVLSLIRSRVFSTQATLSCITKSKTRELLYKISRIDSVI
jgi:hypothetical protein